MREGISRSASGDWKNSLVEVLQLSRRERGDIEAIVREYAQSLLPTVSMGDAKEWIFRTGIAAVTIEENDIGIPNKLQKHHSHHQGFLDLGGSVFDMGLTTLYD